MLVMANFLNRLFARDGPQVSTFLPDDGFADFTTVAAPSFQPPTSDLPSMSSPTPTSLSHPPNSYVYTKWYRVWERANPSDFLQEAIIVPFLITLLIIHLWGSRLNRQKAREWAVHHLPILESEFSTIGFESESDGPNVQEPRSPLAAEKVIRENRPDEFVTYATGRQNVAFLDVKISLKKRFNPFVLAAEVVLGFLFETFPVSSERAEATIYPFDGKEGQLIARIGNVNTPGSSTSSFDGFVWAIVHKGVLRKFREDRYDLSLTTTKEHAKLPNWAAVLSESAEITEILLGSGIVKLVTAAGELFEALVISDMPQNAPTTMENMVPRKRVTLSVRIPSTAEEYLRITPLFAFFIRLTDLLVSVARFRPEVSRKLRATRETETKRLRKILDDEMKEERKKEGDREKKEKRDAALRAMSAEEQKKYLLREREREGKRGLKKRSLRG